MSLIYAMSSSGSLAARLRPLPRSMACRFKVALIHHDLQPSPDGCAAPTAPIGNLGSLVTHRRGTPSRYPDRLARGFPSLESGIWNAGFLRVARVAGAVSNVAFGQ